MATYLLWTGGTGLDGTEAGGWAAAHTTIAAAATAANAAGDIIKVHKANLLTWGTATFTSGVRVVCVDKDNSDALAQMDGTTGYWQTTTSGTLTPGANGNLYVYGIALQGTSTATRILAFGGANGTHVVLESCRVGYVTAASGSARFGGPSTVDQKTYVKYLNCTFVLAGTGTFMELGGETEAEGCVAELYTGASAPTAFLKSVQGDPGGASATFVGCDLSVLGSNAIVGSASPLVTGTVKLSQCKLGSGFVLLDSTLTPANKANHEVFAFDCSDGDTHGLFGYQNAMGSVVSDTGIYATASPNSVQNGATAQPSSWKITTTANCSYFTPFETPWLGYYNSTLSAITPYVEILRTGADAVGQDEDVAFDDDEVWCDMMAKTTSGSTAATLYTNRMTLLGTPAAQTTSSLTASDWIGELAEDWYGKLDVTFTPAEVGHIQCRVCVGIETVLYLDPQIRT